MHVILGKSPDRFHGVPVFFAGISQVKLQDGLITHYGEMFDRGCALVQMNFEPARIVKSLRRWAEEQKPTEEKSGEK